MAFPRFLLALLLRWLAAYRQIFGRHPVVNGILIAMAVVLASLLVLNIEWVADLGSMNEGGTTKRLLRTGQAGLWFGKAATLVIVMVSGLCAPWWLRPLPRGPRLPRDAAFPRALFRAGLAAALVFAAWLSWPRLSLSIYNDEEYCLRSYIRGEVEEGRDGGLRFKPATWAHTVWANPIGNNHVLFSVLSRLSLAQWRWWADADEAALSERAFRMPSWIAGLASLVLLAHLLRLAGFAGAGLVATWLAPLHPWYLRYITEGRGYALMFLFLLLGLIALLRAVETGRWKWWAGFGLAQAAMLLSYAGSVYVALVLNLASVGWLLLLRKNGTLPLRALWRLAVGNALTACVLLLVKVPWAIFQMRHLDSERMQMRVGSQWFDNFWCYLSTGMMSATDDPGNPIHVTVSRLSAEGWPMGAVVYVLLPALVLAGAVRLARSGGAGRVLAAVFVFAAPLGLLHNWANSTWLFLWYLIFALPGYLALLALGITWPDGLLEKWRWPHLVRAGLAALCVLLFAGMTRPKTAVLRSHSKESTRNAVETMRGYTDPTGKRAPGDLLTASFWSEAHLYDPHVRWLKRAPDFAAVLREAHAGGRPLFVTYAHRTNATGSNPTNVMLVDNPALFELVAEFPGLEEAQFTHRVLRYTGADPEPHLPNPLPDR